MFSLLALLLTSFALSLLLTPLIRNLALHWGWVDQPGEIYNLGAQSHVKVSFEVPEFTMDAVAGGPLPAIRLVDVDLAREMLFPDCRLARPGVFRFAGQPDRRPEISCTAHTTSSGQQDTARYPE